LSGHVNYRGRWKSGNYEIGPDNRLPQTGAQVNSTIWQRIRRQVKKYLRGMPPHEGTQVRNLVRVQGSAPGAC